MDEWQGIETAPKDGTLIILFQDGKYGIAGWEDTSHQERELVSSKGRTEVYEWVNVSEGHWEPYPDDIYDPTHWMPLPAAPTT